MQKGKVSKILDGIIARSAFDRLRSGESISFKDRLFLDIIESEGSLAYQFLLGKLQDWQIFQLKIRVGQLIASAPRSEKETSEEFHRSFLSQLIADYSPEQITTLHALVAIALDKSTAVSAILNMYGISPSELHSELLRLAIINSSNSEPTHIKAEIAPAKSAPSKPHPLDKFGRNLTLAARNGEIDPVIGRDRELGQAIEILSRRKKNNPILIGEAGVGKSAVVEALAMRIAQGAVPDNIAERELYSLDISSLIAGTKFRGEFEERMQQLIEALTTSRDTIIFIDEIHTIVGAGSTQGSLDVANILKPALSRGELQIIGATTLDEYRRDIESDSALERRFQRVLIEPTSEETTLEILRRVAPLYQEHHNVQYSDEALSACVKLSQRYITDRHLPDKAIDILDQVGANAHLSALEPLSTNRSEAQTDVGVEVVERVVASIVGVPAERISSSEQERLRTLCTHLCGRVIGQDEAVERLAQSIIRSRAGIAPTNRPIGVFLFVGPTGVGKTLLAKELSKWLFEEQRGLIRLDMSEYSEKHNVSRLIGSPPGYVGYGEGGELSEAVRRRPYSVVLLDEIEKAHPEVYNTMLQIFDEGHLTDGSGRRIDFRNTIIIMTSNVGGRTALKSKMNIGYSNTPMQNRTQKAQNREYNKALESRFSPEFLNRIDDILQFRPLSIESVKQVVDIEIAALQGRVKELGYTLRITESAKQTLAEIGYNAEYGARALRRTISEKVETPLSQLIIEGKAKVGDKIVVEKQHSQPSVKLIVKNTAKCA